MHGKNRIGFNLVETTGSTLKAYSTLKNDVLPGDFQAAGTQEVDAAMKKAQKAFIAYRKLSGTKKAEFLEAIGEEIMSLGDQLVDRVVAESALPEGRIKGERGRTVGQLNLFAALLREGSWVEASIDTAIPDREPLPKADIRKMLKPVGPVVVFTASNFPLAFSTAGGDTAAALAAGNPVIVKAHESHLGTNEMISDAIAKAAEKTGMPDGVFSTLVSEGYEVGQKLVEHPLTKSVAFTGSYRGGMALYEIASKREEPIPVFAEMGSINPVFMMPGKLKGDAAGLAKTYAGSITLGAGQFCTNPGLILGIKSDELTQFAETLAREIVEIQPSTMLNQGIAKNYQAKLENALKQGGVKALNEASKAGANQGTPLVATVSAADFKSNPALIEEVFGPFSLVVICDNEDELNEVTDLLPGQLTTTFMATEKDISSFEDTITRAAERCGRVIFNGVPTGVEVCHSMQHGGPFPASTDGRFTSVGTDAIKRFVRPVAFQDAPESFLPDELKNSNPLKIWRKVNGNTSNETIS